MKIIGKEAIEQVLVYSEVIDLMREALIAQAQGQCHTPIPMHLDIAPESAEVHIKSSYRLGGAFYALKIASTFPNNLSKGLSTGNGLMFLASAVTGIPVALLADGGHLTDVRTAAVSALMARELGRKDTSLGILGTGVQACLQARLHADVLDLREILVWGRSPDRVDSCLDRLRGMLPKVTVRAASSPAQLAGQTRLIVSCSAARQPLLMAADITPGTHISAVGADSPGKQELDPALLERASLLLADSLQQCLRLGELQHAPSLQARTLEMGTWCLHPQPCGPSDVSIGDFTGLGVEDLFIAEYCYGKLSLSDSQTQTH